MPKYSLSYSTKFKKDAKKYRNQAREISALKNALELLQGSGAIGLPEKMRAHKLSGDYEGYWECHVLPDLLIIWQQDDEPQYEIYLIRMGSHASLF